MKKIIRIMLVVIVLCSLTTFSIVGCGTEGGKQDFSDIVFNDVTLDYDGEEHTIVATGIPQDATVNYTNEGPYKNAGEYIITINVSAEGYNTYTKNAKLTINKIDFPSSIVFNDKKVMYLGKEESVLIEGALPDGTEVTYSNNKADKVGEYQASATLTNPNYKTKTLTATLTIYNVLSAAKNVVDEILDRPDPWSFMPEAFTKENISCSDDSTKNFTSFINVNSINKNFMGKQMYVLWEGVEGMEGLLSKFDVVYAVGETIATAYQTFINDNPNNYSVWSSTVAGFKIKIELLGGQSKMLIGNNSFSIELIADTENNVNKGRIDVLNGGSVSYEMKDNYLKFNMGLTIKGVIVMKQVEFVRNDDVVTGYFYEYSGLEAVAVKTSAVIAFNEDYAIVMSAKRESDDLLIEGYEEVYSAKTGEFISAKVLENNKLVDFDTYWVNLFDVVGITSVKMVANGNKLPNENACDVYINFSSEKFVPTKNKIAFVETSRKFDVEMKTVYYVQKVVNGDKVNYEIVETEIPMLFVQKGNVDEFSEDIVKGNKNTFTTTPTLPSSKINVAEVNFESLKTLLDVIKENLTYQELENQLGEKDSIFN